MYIDFRNTPTKFSEFGGLKMIACAVITGICRYMTREAGWRGQTEPYPGSHCHAANDMMEYFVFDEAQIVPCYVIHLDLGRDAAKLITKLSMNPSAYINQYRKEQRKEKYVHRKLGLVVLGHGEKKRQKQALLAKAQKYFPYGFGAATGSKFVVEDVGEVSEDEEEYGIYQKDRVDNAGTTDIWAINDHTNFAREGEGEHSTEDDASEKDLEDNCEEEGEDEIAWEDQMGPEGRTKFDEYYDARKAKNKKQTQIPKRTDWKYIG